LIIVTPFNVLFGIFILVKLHLSMPIASVELFQLSTVFYCLQKSNLVRTQA
jgi:hypothetical protein